LNVSFLFYILWAIFTASKNNKKGGSPHV
jgi:hypothetical protein